MRKQFQLVSSREGVALWEACWATQDVTEGLAFFESENDLLKLILDEYLPREGPTLDGGCGLGRLVIGYGRRGYRMVGLDYAAGTLARVKVFAPGTRLVAGNVDRLPFRDGSFQAYLSQGVVEHFEEGPHRALAEARRVLQPGGLFIVSVPYMNGKRRIEDRLRRSRNGRLYETNGVDGERIAYAIVSAPTVEHTDLPFFQYVFEAGEFCELLGAHGFQVLDRFGCSVAFGVQEFGWVHRLAGRMHRGDSALPRQGASGASRARRGSPGSALREWIREVLIRENIHHPWLGWLVPMLRRCFGNMLLVVARRES